MAKVTNAVEILPKILTACVGRTNVTDRRQMDGQQQTANVADNVAHAAGASILSLVRAVCGGLGGLLLGCATHFHNVAIGTQPVHRLQICPIVHN